MNLLARQKMQPTEESKPRYTNSPGWRLSKDYSTSQKLSKQSLVVSRVVISVLRSKQALGKIA